MKEFIKILKERDYEYVRDGDKIVVTHNGSVFLDNLEKLSENIKFANDGSVFLGKLKELPENIIFANKYGVDLHNLKKLPENTKFANGGYVNLRKLKELPKNSTFANGCGSVFLDNLKKLPENITFTNKGGVDLRNLKKLPETTKFENNGYINLANLETLPETIKFTNGGYIDLRNLKSLPENTTFTNKGGVYLCNLKELPKTTKFANNGQVILNSLANKTITYNGKSVNIIVVDGYTMIVKGRKSKGDFTIYNTEYLVGSNSTFNYSKCIVAEKGGYFAHGRTIKEAIEDVNFKYLQETLDVKQLVKDIKDCGYITSNDYRLLTGACRLGVDRFMVLNNITDDKLPIDKAKKLVEGHYGYAKFMELLG